MADILNRRSVRQLEDTPIEPALLTQLLACAQSAPTKSDLQQYSIIVVQDIAKRATIAEWIGTMPFILNSGAFLVFCGDIRRNRRLGEVHEFPHVNDNLDSFFNATVDGALALQSFVLAAEAAGLACVPVSYIRNHAPRLATLLNIPDGVFPIAGLAVGKPKWAGKPSMRLPQSVVVHYDGYDDGNMEPHVAEYGDRRHEDSPIGPEKQRNTDRYGAVDKCVWSEQVARQLSVPERPDFRAFIESQGFSLK
ncbi:MAG: NADPH-dependent oxidoreductase [Chromatiales bacterium]|nr:NADPH-dependent oxidoreductase [Chromatiales bacterium]